MKQVRICSHRRYMHVPARVGRSSSGTRVDHSGHITGDGDRAAVCFIRFAFSLHVANNKIGLGIGQLTNAPTD